MNLKDKVKIIQAEISSKEKEFINFQITLDGLKAQLASIYKQCNHNWAAKYTPEYKVGYTVPGDPLGTMGIDRRPDMHVPAETIQKWTRICSNCGKVETTTRKKSKESYEPIF